MDEIQRESYTIIVSLECLNEAEVDEIMNGFVDQMDILDQTRWSVTFKRDLQMEQDLKHFRENKEEILASMPEELVQEYFDNGGRFPGNPDDYLEVKLGKQRRHLTVVPDLDNDDLGA